MNCLHLKLYSVMLIFPLAPHKVAHGANTFQIWFLWVKTLRNGYLWNCWTDWLHLKFYGIVSICSCAVLWSLAHFTHMGLPIVHLTHMGLPMGQNVNLWNCWIDFLHFKFCGNGYLCNHWMGCQISDLWADGWSHFLNACLYCLTYFVSVRTMSLVIRLTLYSVC